MKEYDECYVDKIQTGLSLNLHAKVMGSKKVNVKEDLGFAKVKPTTLGEFDMS